MKPFTIQSAFWTLALLFVTSVMLGQDENEIELSNDELSENLDLEAVASIFAEAEDLAEFEEMLNDPDAVISNLDLNEDDLVDYLRVMESAEDDTHVVAIQAVLDEDVYQDVATIEVTQEEEGEENIQIVGDVYVYGPEYIIEPVYVYRPPIFSLWWRPFYRPYRSVFYWGYYPRFYKPWRPWGVTRYRSHVTVHVHAKHTFNYTRVRYNSRAVALHTPLRRNDYAVKYPNRGYAARSVAYKRANGTKVRAAGVNKANGTKKRAVGVNQPDGDKYRAAGVNKTDGTKKRASGVNKADGIKKRAAGVNQADGDKYRAAGVNKPDGTKKRVAGVNKADGTKKRVASVERANGSKKTVAVRKNPDGSKRAVSATKNKNGKRRVKSAGKNSKPRAKGKRKNKRQGKRKGRRK
ncbi:MAG: hypothetical protein OER83_03430 [Flavobacteriaceae bacterium]|nr:hypothetical protein [Flavobacteriaceae bacterium]